MVRNIIVFLETVCLGIFAGSLICNYAFENRLCISNAKAILELQKSVFEMESKIKADIKSNVVLTAYHPKSKGINSDKNPKATATMTKPIAGWTCALSTSLVERGWLGKKVYVAGYGVFKADDRMSPKLSGDRIDLCVGSLTAANRIGRVQDVFVSVLN